MKTGTKAALRAASAKRLRTRLGTGKAIVKAEKAPLVPEVAAGDDLADQAGYPDSPVAAEKIDGVAHTPAPPAPAVTRLEGGRSAAVSTERRYSTTPPRPWPWPFSMANIHSQKKRILRAERERSRTAATRRQIKTYFRRLEAVTSGEDEAAPPRCLELVQTIDKAVKRGALHRNNGARKKSRAARIAARAAAADAWRSFFAQLSVEQLRRSASRRGLSASFSGMSARR